MYVPHAENDVVNGLARTGRSPTRCRTTTLKPAAWSTADGSVAEPGEVHRPGPPARSTGSRPARRSSARGSDVHRCLRHVGGARHRRSRAPSQSGLDGPSAPKNETDWPGVSNEPLPSRSHAYVSGSPSGSAPARGQRHRRALVHGVRLHRAAPTGRRSGARTTGRVVVGGLVEELRVHVHRVEDERAVAEQRPAEHDVVEHLGVALELVAVALVQRQGVSIRSRSGPRPRGSAPVGENWKSFRSPRTTTFALGSAGEMSPTKSAHERRLLVPLRLGRARSAAGSGRSSGSSPPFELKWFDDHEQLVAVVRELGRQRLAAGVPRRRRPASIRPGLY